MISALARGAGAVTAGTVDCGAVVTGGALSGCAGLGSLANGADCATVGSTTGAGLCNILITTDPPNAPAATSKAMCRGFMRWISYGKGRIAHSARFAGV